MGECSKERSGTVCQIVHKERRANGDVWGENRLSAFRWLSYGGGDIV